MAAYLLRLRRAVTAEEGQTNVELGAILVLVSIVAVAILSQIGDQVIPMFAPIAAGF